jgi:hypothetical protein
VRSRFLSAALIGLLLFSAAPSSDAGNIAGCLAKTLQEVVIERAASNLADHEIKLVGSDPAHPGPRRQISLRLGRRFGGGAFANVYAVESVSEPELTGLPADVPAIAKIGHSIKGLERLGATPPTRRAIRREYEGTTSILEKIPAIESDPRYPRNPSWKKGALPLIPITGSFESLEQGLVLFKPALTRATFLKDIPTLTPEMIDGLRDIYDLTQAIYGQVQVRTLIGGKDGFSADIRPPNLAWVDDPQMIRNLGWTKPGWVMFELDQVPANVHQYVEPKATRVALAGTDTPGFLRYLDEFKTYLKPAADPQLPVARARGFELRSKEIAPEGSLSARQSLELTRLLQLTGIRRSRVDRLYQRVKGKLGFESKENKPIILPGQAPTAAGDEARFLLDQYNSRIRAGDEPAQAYDTLAKGLYDAYAKRAAEPLSDPWFAIGGVPRNLTDFIAQEGYLQRELSSSNQWMTVGRLRPETVQNPMMSGKLTRELWWNRKAKKGIQPLGTVRISRNIQLLPGGTEKVVSVEVLVRDKNKSFVPFTFEPDETGVMKLAKDAGDRKSVTDCFACHFRLNGIFFGGISMPRYNPSPDWYINAIDRVLPEYHRKFEDLRH